MRRNYRYIYCLLAALIIFSQMRINANAGSVYHTFSDKDQIVNQEAVSSLADIGVINGKPSGCFDPQGNVTRAEMAKMICIIMNKGKDMDDNAQYLRKGTDLTDIEGHWAGIYIDYCYSLGIIAGRGNGRFDPDADVTAEEAAKMLLVAAGYDPEKRKFTGKDWAVHVSEAASRRGLYDGYEDSATGSLNRDAAALLLYNALMG